MFLKGYQLNNLKQDIPAGLIMALVSIPISIGYALVAGLPPVYGLYGAVLPTIVFGLLSSSPRFYFGVDAAPAALVGGMLFQLGITYQSPEALAVIPVITLIVALWLLLFRIFGFGQFVRFISTPVMGGFITGIGCTIILMQIPKLYGGDAGRGELVELVEHIFETAKHGVNAVSLALGVGTIAVILISKKFIPKVPMSAIMMFVGAGLAIFFPLEEYGVKMLPAVAPGLPKLVIPSLALLADHGRLIVMSSLTIALVILAETLLATNSYAVKYDDAIDNNREILAYAGANLAAAITGSCPVNGSVSRTGIADQFGVRSQMMSLVSGLTMAMILLFGTGFIAYLPVPVLTAIVISALMGILEFDLAHSLRKVDRAEYRIFYAVLFTVLIFGTVYGVLIGIVLSFVTVIVRASTPPRDILGYQVKSDRFYPLNRVRGVKELRHVKIYRFSGALFFANIEMFQKDVEKAIDVETKVVIIDGSGITSIDVTAAERLLVLYEKCRERDIRFFITEHDSAVNDQLRTFGCEVLFDDGAIRKSIPLALASAGYKKPYELELHADGEAMELGEKHSSGVSHEQAAEIEWAYGKDAETKMQEMAEELAIRFAEEEEFNAQELVDAERAAFGSRWTKVDEERFLDFLELQAAKFERNHRIPAEKLHRLEERLLGYHAKLDALLAEKDPELLEHIVLNRISRERRFRERNPEAFELFRKERRRHHEILRQNHPELVAKIDEIRQRNRNVE